MRQLSFWVPVIMTSLLKFRKEIIARAAEKRLKKHPLGWDIILAWFFLMNLHAVFDAEKQTRVIEEDSNQTVDSNYGF